MEKRHAKVEMLNIMTTTFDEDELKLCVGKIRFFEEKM